MSSIYKEFNQRPTNQMGEFINQFNQFRQAFTGNPEQRVKQLLQSGQMSQEQFNSYAQTANMLSKFIK